MHDPYMFVSECELVVVLDLCKIILDILLAFSIDNVTQVASAGLIVFLDLDMSRYEVSMNVSHQDTFQFQVVLLNIF
jgi:hypothetical protein